MRLLIWVFILSIVQFHVAIAQNQKESFKNKTPKLIVGIVIEEMRYEMLLRYWDSFGDDGFKKIIDNGSLCTNGKYNYLITQNSVGHASIVTGTNPSYHGIIADTWYNRLTDKVINSTTDNFSPQNLLVSSFGD